MKMLRLLIPGSPLHRAFSPQPVLPQVLSEIRGSRSISPGNEQWLVWNAQRLPPRDFVDVLQACVKCPLPTVQLAETLKITSFNHAAQTNYRVWNALFSLSRLRGQFSTLKIDLSTEFQEVTKRNLDRNRLKQLHIFQMQLMLSTYFNLVYPNDTKTTLFATRTADDIFSESEELLTSALAIPPASNLPDWYSILRVYILCDKGSEDFRRLLEKTVLSSLPLLSTHTVVDLPFLYKNRTTFDYFYMKNSVLEPYLKEVIRRFQEFSLTQLGMICYRIWWSLGKYGVYYDAEFTDLLKSRISQANWQSNSSPETIIFFASNVVIYLSNIAVAPLNTLIDELLAVIVANKRHLDDKQAVQLAHALSRIHNFDPQFWDDLLSRLDTITKDTNMSGYVYSGLLQMQFVQPEMHKRFLASKSLSKALPAIREAWKSNRTRDLGLSKTSFLHKAVEKYLQDHACRYESEFYDEYYIDIALPDQKIALEICGTMHYILPHKTLNGKTTAKKFVLEQLGWRVIIIPFFYQRQDSALCERLDALLGSYMPRHQQ